MTAGHQGGTTLSISEERLSEDAVRQEAKMGMQNARIIV